MDQSLELVAPSFFGCVYRLLISRRKRLQLTKKVLLLTFTLCEKQFFLRQLLCLNQKLCVQLFVLDLQINRKTFQLLNLFAVCFLFFSHLRSKFLNLELEWATRRVRIRE